MESLFVHYGQLPGTFYDYIIYIIIKLATWCCWQVSRLWQVMFERATQPKFASTCIYTKQIKAKNRMNKGTPRNLQNNRFITVNYWTNKVYQRLRVGVTSFPRWPQPWMEKGSRPTKQPKIVAYYLENSRSKIKYIQYIVCMGILLFY